MLEKPSDVIHLFYVLFTFCMFLVFFLYVFHKITASPALFNCINELDVVLLLRLYPKIYNSAKRTKWIGRRSIRTHRTRRHLTPPGSRAIPGGRNVREGVQTQPASHFPTHKCGHRSAIGSHWSTVG